MSLGLSRVTVDNAQNQITPSVKEQNAYWSMLAASWHKIGDVALYAAQVWQEEVSQL